MHIDNGSLVGTYVSDRYSEKGTVTIVLTDGDSTPTREYTRYKYVQTEQLTAIGVAVKDYGAVLVPETTIELFNNGTLNAADFGVFVKFNGEYYNIGLSTLLGTDIGAAVTFNDGGLDSYAPTTFNATLPPYSVGNAGQVPTVDENGKVGWDDIPEELPSVTGNAGKLLGVNSEGTGVEWTDIPNPLPDTANNRDKVLKVNIAQNGVEWAEIPLLPRVDFTVNSAYVVTKCEVQPSIFWIYQANELSFDEAKLYFSTIKKCVGRPITIYYNGSPSNTFSGCITRAATTSTTITINAIGIITKGNDHTQNVIEAVWTKSTNKLEYTLVHNLQELPTIGSGDSGKVLKVNAGETGVEWGAASGGGQLYRHKIKLEKPSIINSFTVTVISTDATAYTESGFISYLTNHGSINANKALPVDANCSYRSNLTNMVKIVTGVYADSNLIYTYTHNISVSNGEITDSASTATVSFVEDVCEAL